MARRATIINGARTQHQNLLVLDAGNSLIGEQFNSREPAPKTQGRSSVEILNRLGYDVVALGDQDLSLGQEELVKRLSEARAFTFVSANVSDQATGQLLARPYVIREIGGHRVALIGLTGQVSEAATGFTLVPPLVAARDYVRQLESQADVIILLSNAGLEANKTIGSQVPGIDLIISGGQEALPEPLQLPGGTLIVQADRSSPGHAGRVVGSLQVEFDPSGRLTHHSWQSIELGPSVPDDPEMAEWAAEATKG